MKGIHNKVAITVEGGVATLYNFPLDIAVNITDKDEDDDTRQGGNRYASLATRWEYLCKRVDHDCDLILRLAARKIREIFPYYDDVHWRNETENIGAEEYEIQGERVWYLGSIGLQLVGVTENIELDDLDVSDRFDFVQALMVDYEILIKEITKYGKSYKQSRLASRGE